MAAGVIRALLEGAIDYAGLFPPAALPMREAASHYDAYRRGTDAWALGRFVVPVARLDELVEAAEDLWRADGQPWRLSALPGAELAPDADRITAFNLRHGRYAVVDSVEVRAPSHAAVRDIELVFGRDGRHEIFVEVPAAEDPTTTLAAIAARGLNAKIRTGGITPEQFPSAANVARFLAGCARLQLPFKATAGLHHPIRADYRLTYAPDSPRGTMFGFLNVFAAAAAARRGADEPALVALLEERDVAALPLQEEVVRDARARFALSFGSCSFEEPLADLRSLGLL